MAAMHLMVTEATHLVVPAGGPQCRRRVHAASEIHEVLYEIIVACQLGKHNSRQMTSWLPVYSCT